MKNLFLLSMAIIGFSLTSGAQNISDNAIGLRIGDSNGFGAEVSYQRALGDNNRLEADLGWRNDAFKLTGLYQWVFPLDASFHWYVGAGGGVLSGDNFTGVFAAGDIGIEYDFEIPLLLSLDFRPELGFGDLGNDVDFDIALGIRYQF